MRKVNPHITAALAAVVASAAMAGAATPPPLPVGPNGQHATGQAATNQRLADLSSRLDNVEAVTSILQRCKVKLIVRNSQHLVEWTPNKYCR